VPEADLVSNGTVPLNTIAQTLGYDIIEAENGRVVVNGVPREIHLNPAGTVHTGPIKAEGVVISRDRRVGTAEARVRTARSACLSTAPPLPDF
jgi:acyl-coenzyme A thioesterase PaaI-like protein